MDLGRDPRVLAQFRKEAIALARVNSDAVVKVFAYGVHDNLPFFTMEHADGPSLRHILRKHREHNTAMPAERALTLVRQIASGLGDIHAEGLVHRDVKPENVIIRDGTSKPILIDFGVAAGTQAKERSAGLAGTPGYMPPEQAGLGREVFMSASMDIYALGVMTFEIFTGELPFDGDSTMEILTRQSSLPTPRLSTFRPDLAALDGVLLKALSLDPAQRYHDGHAFARALMEGSAAISARHAEAKSSFAAPTSLRVPEGVLKVLVVEDDTAIRTFISRAAKLAFFRRKLELCVVSNAADALVVAERETPHLMLLDYQLPGLTGLELLRQLRGLPGGEGAEAIVVTAHLPEHMQADVDELRVARVLRKPVGLRELVDTILEIGVKKGWIDTEVAQTPGAAG